MRIDKYIKKFTNMDFQEQKEEISEMKAHKEEKRKRIKEVVKQYLSITSIRDLELGKRLDFANSI